MPAITSPPSRVVRHPPATCPLLIYDGDCGFCRRWIARWKRVTGARGLPGFMPVARAAYRFIASHRAFFSRFSVI